MRRALPRSLILAAVGIGVLLLSACSSGEDTVRRAQTPDVYHIDTPVADKPADADNALVVANSPRGVLAISAERTQEVDSFRGEFTMTFGTRGFSMKTIGEFTYVAPSTMHMTMELLGQSVEVLMDLPDIYMNIPGEGWYILSTDNLGIDWEAYAAYAEQRGLVDYSAITEQMEGVVQVEDDTIDGVTYHHYQGELDLDAIAQDVPAGIFDPAVLAQTEDLGQRISAEIWVEQDTYLPHRMDMFWEMEVPGEDDLLMKMSFVYLDYNEPFDIPDAPTDARPLDLPGF